MKKVGSNSLKKRSGKAWHCVIVINHEREQFVLIGNKQILSDCGNKEGELAITEVILNKNEGVSERSLKALLSGSFNYLEAKLSAIKTTFI